MESSENARKGKPFKVQDDTGKRKHLVIYKTFESFEETCKRKFEIDISDQITFETEDNFQLDGESIEYQGDNAILIVRVRGDEDVSGPVSPNIPEQAADSDAAKRQTEDSKQKVNPSAKQYSEWSSKLMEKITAGKDKLEKHIKQYGEKGVEKIIRETLDDGRTVPLVIAVMGRSGNGKSSLINAIRGVSKGDPTYADVGTTETTMTLTPYPHPHYENIILWDIHGVGTDNFPKETYLSKIQVDKYDFFIICSSTRFSDDDSWLASEIQKRNRNF
ncbi:uncharacterized protein LOC128549503 [Mercenaria mercenaria]|uniref:uncharacterized protein LOC128549503 n=1 Tax=Mercenaria mercenaria TaxID=6596 RepID=UPI00234E6068|nr:uncharacterized protein LOC128549503 [Mercenaria mercenaria]XP_053382209.1 uncharacterized protein LOC128549503 [Mercenaria mercenaria]